MAGCPDVTRGTQQAGERNAAAATGGARTNARAATSIQAGGAIRDGRTVSTAAAAGFVASTVTAATRGLTRPRVTAVDGVARLRYPSDQFEIRGPAARAGAAKAGATIATQDPGVRARGSHGACGVGGAPPA